MNTSPPNAAAKAVSSTPARTSAPAARARREMTKHQEDRKCVAANGNCGVCGDVLGWDVLHGGRVLFLPCP